MLKDVLTERCVLPAYYTDNCVLLLPDDTRVAYLAYSAGGARGPVKVATRIQNL